MNNITGFKIDQLEIGQKASFSKTISETDVYLFTSISGDTNPAHINESYARETIFKERIAHGMLTGALISAVLGVQLPGPGTIYRSQSLNFLKPVRFGDTITAQVEITEINLEKNRIKLETSCFNQNGDKVTSGEAVVLPPI